LEHIYRKIYVESRTAAAAKAYEMASIAIKQIVRIVIKLMALDELRRLRIYHYPEFFLTRSANGQA